MEKALTATCISSLITLCFIFLHKSMSFLLNIRRTFTSRGKDRSSPMKMRQLEDGES